MTQPPNTPLNADDELRRKISKMCEGIAAGYHGEDGIDYIMQLILADRKKHELQARMDELRSLQRAFWVLGKGQLESRINELKQELSAREAK